MHALTLRYHTVEGWCAFLSIPCLDQNAKLRPIWPALPTAHLCAKYSASLDPQSGAPISRPGRSWLISAHPPSRAGNYWAGPYCARGVGLLLRTASNCFAVHAGLVPLEIFSRFFLLRKEWNFLCFWKLTTTILVLASVRMCQDFFLNEQVWNLDHFQKCTNFENLHFEFEPF